MSNTLTNGFVNIDPQMLDEWFEEKINKFKNCPAAVEHYKYVYNELVGNTVQDESLARFYDERMI